jgi:hypothetical protein
MKSKQELSETLARLRAEVEGLGFRDPEAPARVHRLIADIERQLGDAGDSSQRASLLESLPKTIEELEVEHPQLTAVLSRIVTALSSMGI